MKSSTLHLKKVENGVAYYAPLSSESVKMIAVEWEISEILPRFVVVDLKAIHNDGEEMKGDFYPKER